MVDKVKENYLRRQAKRLNLVIKKSRARKVHFNDYGLYQIIEPYSNKILLGKYFDAKFEEVASFLNDYENSLRRG